MKTITVTTDQIQTMAEAFYAHWENEKEKIQLSPRALYNLLHLRKQVETQGRIIQETVQTLAEKAGGVVQPNGSFKIPPDQIDNLNQQLLDLSKQTVEIQYNPILVRDSDNLPVGVMEAILDFIEMVE